MLTLTNDLKSNILTLREGCKAVYKDNQILTDLTICQAILESRLQGTPSKLALPPNNNLFGIKGVGTAGYVLLPTKEYTTHGWITVDQRFAKNKSIEDSIRQHSELLSRSRYERVRNSKTFSEAAKMLYKCGYATDPEYPKKLIYIYERLLK